ncbi:MAG: hypothetical protein BZY88_14170 [SAR202 cluster bacterium Io17-Chloro-G9]|nr:MAG: hypothetical protein BZY88_14170 [SAR202 cluster bacterium Io17-Chloro-G9]
MVGEYLECISRCLLNQMGDRIGRPGSAGQGGEEMLINRYVIHAMVKTAAVLGGVFTALAI